MVFATTCVFSFVIITSRLVWTVAQEVYVPNGTSCERGWVFHQQTQRCHACPPGQYDSQNDVCAPCPAGTRQPFNASWTCIACDPGRYTGASESSATSCDLCPPGKFGERAGGSACVDCPTGRYNPVYGRPFCSLCPPGGTCVGNESLGALLFVPSEEYYYLGDANSIVDGFQKQIEAATWNLYSSEGFEGLGPFRCPADGACKGENVCVEGMEGPLCASCSTGYAHQHSEDLCGQCPSAGVNYGLFVVFMMCVWLAAVFIDRKHFVRMGKPKQVRSVVFKILYRFLVQFSVVNSNVRLDETLLDAGRQNGLNWPWVTPVVAALSFGKALENPSEGVYSLHCFSEWVGTKVLMAWLLIPIMMVLHVIFTTLALVVAHYRDLRRVAPETDEWNGDASKEKYVPLHVSVWTNVRPIGIVLIYFLHPMITAQLLGAYDCMSFNEDTQLQYDTPRWRLHMKVDCEGVEHRGVQVAAALGLCVWSFGIPIGFCCLVWWYNHKGGSQALTSPKVWRTYGFLMDGYEPEFYYYDAIFMLRRVCFLMCAKLTWFSDDSRTVIMTLVDVLFLALHLHHQPYDNRGYSALDKLETWCIFVLFFILLGRLFQQGLDPKRFEHPNIMVRLGYAPGVMAFFYTAFFGVYLMVRYIIWPPDRPTQVLPKSLSVKLDGRAHFTLIPPGAEELRALGFMEHVTITARSLNLLTEGYGDVEECELPERERSLIKQVIAGAIDIVLKRHEQCFREAPDVICLPSFMLQVERILVACICKAMKTRLSNETRRKELDTTAKKIAAAVEFVHTNVQQMLGYVEAEHQTLTEEQIEMERTLMRRPISGEEIHLALMDLGSQLLDPGLSKRRSVLHDFAVHNKKVLDSYASTSWIFEPEAHLSRVEMWRHVAKMMDPADDRPLPPCVTSPIESVADGERPSVDDPDIEASRTAESFLMQARAERAAAEEALRFARAEKRHADETFKKIRTMKTDALTLSNSLSDQKFR